MDTRRFLSVKDAVYTSPLFRLAVELDPSIVTANMDKLDGSYTLKVCRELLYEAWGIVLTAMLTGESSLQKFRLLPVTIQTSPLCIAVLLENDQLYTLALQGKVSYTGIVKLALYKGIWAR